MSSLVEHVRQQFSAFYADTASYRYSTVGLTQSADLIKAIEREQLRRRAENFDDEQYFALIREGGGRYESARQLGIDPVVIRRRIKYDEYFAEAVLVAEAEALEPAIRLARADALGGNLKTLKWLAERKSAEEFGQQEQKININVTTNNSGADDSDPIVARIRALEADVIKRQHARQLGPEIIDAEVVDDAAEE